MKDYKTSIWNVTYLGVRLWDNPLSVAIYHGYIEQPGVNYNKRPVAVNYPVTVGPKGGAKYYESYIKDSAILGPSAIAGLNNVFAFVDASKELWIESLELPEDFEVTVTDGTPALPEQKFDGKEGVDKLWQAKADYYFDKKGRLGFKDAAINTHYTKSSEKLDPENGERNLHSYLEVAARNEEAQKAGAYPENTCLVCGEDLPVKAPGTRGPKQKYCTTCKPFVKLAMDAESNMRRDRLNMESSVPKEDFLFVKYMNNMYIKNKSTKKVTVKDIVKTSVKKPKGKKPDTFKGEACECGGRNFELYKPWKPDDDGRFGKIGSKVLYCKDCGLVVGYGQQSTATTGEI